MKIEIRKSKSNRWYFRFVARNGRILCHSDTYHRLSDAKKGVASVVNGFRGRDIFSFKRINDNEWVVK